MRKVFFDIETKNEFSSLARNDPTLLDISVVCIYDTKTETYSCFEQNQFSSLWPIIENSDVLIGFNSDHFDVPVLNKYYPGDLTQLKSLDILAEIKKSYGRRMKLDQIAEGTLGIKKSGNGLDAIKWWRNKEFDKVKNYCIDDVRITKEIYEYAMREGKLFFKESGKTNTIVLDTKGWEDSGTSRLTHTLPF